MDSALFTARATRCGGYAAAACKCVLLGLWRLVSSSAGRRLGIACILAQPNQFEDRSSASVVLVFTEPCSVAFGFVVPGAAQVVCTGRRYGTKVISVCSQRNSIFLI
jgi:hypothetical protein